MKTITLYKSRTFDEELEFVKSKLGGKKLLYLDLKELKELSES